MKQNEIRKPNMLRTVLLTVAMLLLVVALALLLVGLFATRSAAFAL